MMSKNIFDVLILLGRPASGKSEIIDYLTHLPAGVRRQRYHIAELDILDDFPMLWVWFEEDDILSRKLGLPRLHNDEHGYFKYKDFWHLLIERLSLEYHKRLRDQEYHANKTTLIEFSRGSEHGGYAAAFSHLSDELLQQAAIVYVRVPYEESLRKNRRRFNPDRPDSILEHGMSDGKLERLYRDDDFASIAEGDSGWLSIRGRRVPYVVFPNEDDVTTGKPEQLGVRLESLLESLWDLYQRAGMQISASDVETDY